MKQWDGQYFVKFGKRDEPRKMWTQFLDWFGTLCSSPLPFLPKFDSLFSNSKKKLFFKSDDRKVYPQQLTRRVGRLCPSRDLISSKEPTQPSTKIETISGPACQPNGLFYLFTHNNIFHVFFGHNFIEKKVEYVQLLSPLL